MGRSDDTVGMGYDGSLGHNADKYCMFSHNQRCFFIYLMWDPVHDPLDFIDPWFLPISHLLPLKHHRDIDKDGDDLSPPFKVTKLINYRPLLQEELLDLITLFRLTV